MEESDEIRSRIAPHLYTEEDDDAGIRCGMGRLRFLFIGFVKDMHDFKPSFRFHASSTIDQPEEP